MSKTSVIEYFERALKNGMCSVNFYYSPNTEALEDLIKEGTIKIQKIGSLHIGWEYKGHLFDIRSGYSDCEENLYDLGKI